MFTRRMSVVVTALLVALVTLGLVASALVPAFSATRSALPQHAALTGTSPEDGSTVDTVDEVVISFSEEVDEQFLQVKVDGPDGDEADGDPTVDGRDVVQALPADLPAGEHEVTYRVVSVDGHPVSGTFSFTSTEEPETASPSPSPSASGSASAEPSTTTDAPAPTPSADSSVAAAPASSSGTPGWVLPAVLVAFLVLVGSGTALVARRRSTSDAEHRRSDD